MITGSAVELRKQMKLEERTLSQSEGSVIPFFPILHFVCLFVYKQSVEILISERSSQNTISYESQYVHCADCKERGERESF